MKTPALLLLVCLMGHAAAGSEMTSGHPAGAGRRSLAGRDLMARSPPSTGYADGFVFSFIVPGYTPLTFTSNKAKALCAEVSDIADLPPKITMNCTVDAVASFNDTNVIASGKSFARWAVSPTPTEESVFVARRDAWLKTLTTAPATVFKTFPGSVPNCACAGTSTVTKSSTISYSYAITVLSFGPLQCDARLVYPGGTLTSQIGVDDGTDLASNKGKFCSTPPVEGGVLGTPGQDTCITYGVVATGMSDGTRAEINPQSIQVVSGALQFPEQNPPLVAGSGYTAPPTVTISAPNPTPLTFTWNLDNAGSPMPVGYGNFDINFNTGFARNGPYEQNTRITLTALEDVCVDVGTIPWGTDETVYGCTGPIKNIVFMDEFEYTGKLCTAEDFNNGVGGRCGSYYDPSFPNMGNPGGCVDMSGFSGLSDNTNSNNFVNSVSFPGWDPRCAKAPQATVSTGNLQPAVNAEATAVLGENGDVINVVLTNPGSGYRWPPKVTIARPPVQPTSNIGKLCSSNPISGLDSANFLATAVAEGVTVDGSCRPLGRDTYLNKPCSVPAVAGGVWAPLNAFTCNVDSSFRSQPNAPNDFGSCAVLPQSLFF